MSNHGLMLHWGRWDGIWWTAGASWLARWFPEQWRYTGGTEFARKRVVPLLKDVAQFYESFMTTNAATGQYEFIPSYSPESLDGITATMDVMAVKDTLMCLVETCAALGIEQGNVTRWQAMLANLPPYRINQDGALAEWIPPAYGEHYAHRHLSHRHAAYEATGDLSPDGTPELWKAAQEATRRRIDANGEQSSHGRMHMGLAAAYLGLADEAYGRVAIMATEKSMYPSLITSHEPGQRTFNTDANGAIPEIVIRMLVSSSRGRLELLPALPSALSKGSIQGILARGQIHMDRLAWDVKAGTVTAAFTSGVKQNIVLVLPSGVVGDEIKVNGKAQKVVTEGVRKKGCHLTLAKGKAVTIELQLQPEGRTATR
jgi:hypothetical protein